MRPDGDLRPHPNEPALVMDALKFAKIGLHFGAGLMLQPFVHAWNLAYAIARRAS